MVDLVKLEQEEEEMEMVHQNDIFNGSNSKTVLFSISLKT